MKTKLSNVKFIRPFCVDMSNVEALCDTQSTIVKGPDPSLDERYPKN